MKPKNKEIEKAILLSGLKKWQIADKLGIADSSFSRKLRKELPQAEKEKIFEIIEEFKMQNEEVF